MKGTADQVVEIVLLEREASARTSVGGLKTTRHNGSCIIGVLDLKTLDHDVICIQTDRRSINVLKVQNGFRHTGASIG